jgi:hypothetical protein
MAGTDADHSTPRPTSPISPTEALRLALSLNPNRSIHRIAIDLTDWTHGNECRLWCNGNLLSPKYISDSLKIVADTEADGRPRAAVVSSTREAWDDSPAAFELDYSEVRAQAHALIDDKPTNRVIAPGQPAAVESSDSASTKSWITSEVDQMKDAEEITISPTALAAELAKRMEKVARTNPSIQPVSKGYIRGLLYQLGLVVPRRRRR